MTMDQVTAIKPTYGYYRQPNGWITVSPVTQLEEVAYIRDGWQSLPRYGRVEMTTEYMADHPLEPLFMAGGAKELFKPSPASSGTSADASKEANAQSLPLDFDFRLPNGTPAHFFRQTNGQ